MVPEGAEGTNNRFFATAAQNLLTGLILHVAGSELGEQRNLVTVRRFLTADRDDFALLIRTMKGSANPAVIEVANRYQQMLGDDPKLAQNIITTAVEYTDFLASEAVDRMLRRSDFHAEDLKRRVISVFMIIPPDQLGVYYQLLRLFIGCFCNALSRTQGAPAQRVLFMLDEFPALRRMEPIEKAIAYARGYGGQFWLIAQDLNQMRGTYGDWAKSLIANCRCKSAFGIADLETARELSAMMGQTTIITESKSRSSGANGAFTGTRSESTGEAARALLYPDEVMRLPPTEEIVMIPGMPPIRCRKLRYYADPAFAGLYDSWNG
jgi:type IV secretion system protein VirD4